MPAAMRRAILLASLALMLVGVAMVGYSYIQWWVEDYVVTNQKVVKVAGSPVSMPEA